MRLSIERLRWVLAAGALLLVAVLSAYIGYGRIQALNAYRRILKKNGISISHDTNGVTFSQTLQGKTIFTLKAGRATPHGDGTYTLYNTVLTMYGRVEHRTDVVYASQVEYDDKQGIARAQGEVQMDLQAPQVLTSGNKAGASPEAHKPGESAPPVIHVRTSGLVYLRRLGVAATEEPVEFRYGAMRCTARGAEFNTSQSTLRLLADVVMNGELHGSPVQVVAERADMDRMMNVATLAQPVVTSLDRSGRAREAVLTLRKDGSIETVRANGAVQLKEGTREVNAALLEAMLSPQTVPQAARLWGGVTLTDTDALRPAQGSASQVQMRFTPQGALAQAVASGAVKLTLQDRSAAALTAAPRTANGQGGLQREMEGATVTAVFTPVAAVAGRRAGSRLTELHAVGAAHALGESPAKAAGQRAGGAAGRGAGGAPQLKTLQVSADDLRLLFGTTASGQPQAQRLLGQGHTLLQQDAPLGERETSSGETLEASFAPAPAAGSSAKAASSTGLTLTSAVQTGGVIVHSQAAATARGPGARSVATAERASYEAATERLTLTGQAHLEEEDANLAADTVTLDRRSDEAEAAGAVRATLRQARSTAPGGAGGASADEATVTHVLSASARFFHATRIATFRGSDAVPARVWQGGSQVQAAELLFDDEHRTFSARPAAAGALVHAIFAQAPAAGASRTAGTGANRTPARGGVVRVSSPKMDYSDLQHEAVFAGGVHLADASGEAQSERAVAFLTPPSPAKQAAKPVPSAALPDPVGGSLERMVLEGDVQLEQPGRHGTGEQLTYTAASGNYVLTGTAARPPHIVDQQQGSVTGPTLLFRDGGSTIVVAGDAAAKTAKGGRIHSETELKP